MAFENLFIRTKKSIGGIQLDAVLSESHTNTVRLTKNPVEVGTDITDNAIIDPAKLSIVATVTDSPLGLASLGRIVDFVTGLFGTSTSSNLTRSNAAFNALIQLQNEREPISIQTKLKLYENMIITNVSTQQDKDTSRIVELFISLEKLNIVNTEVTTLEADSLLEGVTKEQGSPADKAGLKVPINPVETVKKSVLKSVKDWVVGEAVETVLEP